MAEEPGFTSDWEAAIWCNETFGPGDAVGPANDLQNNVESGINNDARQMNDQSSRMTGPRARKIGLTKGSSSTSRLAKPESSQRPETNKPLAFALEWIAPQPPFLETWSLLPTHAEHLGAGFLLTKCSMSGRFVFPIHNQQGELVAYAGRVLADQEPRWKLPEGSRRAWCSTPENTRPAVSGKSVARVENFWGMMACVRAGVMNSVASMGRTIPDSQLEVVRQLPITSVMDGDEPGK